jgi:hypothetical protein
MIETPIWLNLVFIMLTFLSIYGLFASFRNYQVLFWVLIVTVVSGFIGYSGFLYAPDAFPPRIPLIILPAILFLLWLFVSKTGKAALNEMDMAKTTYVHSIRIPVELGILALFNFGFMPESMTFEGHNFDILSGLSAPFVAYFGYTKKYLKRSFIIIWNTVCLGLLIQVVVTGILSAPTILQQIDFDQPNVAVLYFPFIWLPAVIVPIVMIGHLAALRRLLKSEN